MSTIQPKSRRLTVAIIARDVEQTIAATLDSVRDVADEIIVADTGSIDRTRQVALTRATRVVDIKWSDDFAAARNACLDQVTGNWVLWLDAGERIEPATAKEIRRFIDEKADATKVYMLLVQLPATGEHQMVEQAGRVRLMPNRPELRFIGRVRETVRQTVAAAGLGMEITSWTIQRGAADHNPAIKAAKGRRDLKLAELEIRDRGVAPAPLIVMGESWTNLGDPRQGADHFRKALAVSQRGSTEMLEAYYGLLTSFDHRPEARDEQVQACLEAIDIFPLDAQLLCAMGCYMQRAGRLDLASRAYRSAVQHGQLNLETWHVAAIRDVATACLSLTLELLGDDEGAIESLQESLAGDAGSIRLRRRLIDLYIKHDRRKEALAQVAELPADTPTPGGAARTAVRGACLAAQKNWTAARAYLQTAYDAGCRDLLCLRWLSVTLLSIDEVAAAEPILRQWIAVAPGTVEAQKYLEAIAAGRQQAGAANVGAASIGAEPAKRLLRIDSPAIPSPLSLSGTKSDAPSPTRR